MFAGFAPQGRMATATIGVAKATDMAQADTMVASAPMVD
jgi:hypothetical protein